jgi:hypothetical protein
MHATVMAMDAAPMAGTEGGEGKLGNKDTRKGKIKMVKNYSALCLYNFVPI